MRIPTGFRIGPYEIVAAIGAGGMGEVYRARDTRLNRDVALKVLPETVAADPDRLARFTREAQVLAALNHPHIAAIHGLEETSSVQALVLELVDGPTLADRIARGPVPIAEALVIARQIADAIEAAHEQGIIHRDLKPANIKVRPDGTVKVLDFGLAKALDDSSSNPSRTLGDGFATAAQTVTSPAMTQLGVILGTAAYMSPEQATGRAADKRADIWAFGCVLYEMMTGLRPFEGDELSMVLASVLKTEPDWNKLPSETPLAIRRLLSRCLKKNPKERLQAIGDARIELEELRSDITVLPTESVPLGRNRQVQVAAAAGLAVGALVAGIAAWWLLKPSPVLPGIARVTITLPANAALSLSGAWTAASVAISPDGTRIAYIGTSGEASQVYLRTLAQLDVAAIAGTDGALNPFFSPDGEWVGFFAGGKLKKVRPGGGAPVTLCDATFGFGAAWTDDGSIVFAPALTGGLSRVSADGGQPQQFTTLAAGELAHRWPAVVQGSRDVLFVAAPEVTSWAGAAIAVQSLDAKDHRILIEGATAPRYASTSRVLFARGGSLFAVSVDRSRWATTGAPVEVHRGVAMDNFSGRAQYALSTNGTLVYLAGGEENVQRSLAWVDRHGSAQPVSVNPRGFERPRISPDGQQVALTIREADADVWVLALERSTLTRLTNEIGEDESPLWSPDGRRVVYSSTRGGARQTLSKDADGSGTEEQLFVSETHQHLVDWTPDGRTLLTDENEPGDLLERRVGDKAASRIYLNTPFYKRGARLSPDGRWLAYCADESGRNEVYVQAKSGRWRISVEGGSEPVWARNGKELFYRNGDRMMSVDIETTPVFHAGTPRTLFESRYARLPWGEADYDVSPDGRRFLMIKGDEKPPSIALEIVINWIDEIRRIGR